MVQRVVRVGTVYNSRQKNEGRIVFEAVFFEDCLKSAFLAVVAKLDSLHIKGSGSQSLCIAQDALRWNEEEFRLRIYEFLDQPWAGHPIHVHSFACNPFHDFHSLGCDVARKYFYPSRRRPRLLSLIGSGGGRTLVVIITLLISIPPTADENPQQEQDHSSSNRYAPHLSLTHLARPFLQAIGPTLSQLFGAPAAIHGSSTFSIKSGGNGLGRTGAPVSTSMGMRFPSCTTPNRPVSLSIRKLA